MLKLKNLFISTFIFTTTIATATVAEPIKVGIPVKESEPFVIQKGESIDGMIVEVWKNIAQDKNLEYELIPQTNYNNALEMVGQGELDILIGAITITHERLQKVEFTLPIDEFDIVVLTQSEPPTMWSRIKPFLKITAISSFGLLVVSVFIVGNLIWLAEHRDNTDNFPKKYASGVKNGMWFAVVTLTTVGYGDFAPITNIGRLVASIWMLITLLALSSITAGLASAMTIALSNQSNPRFTKAEDLRQAKIAVVRDWASSIWADYYGADTIEVATFDEAVNLVLEGEADGFIDNRANLAYHLIENPELNLSIADFIIGNQIYGFALPLDSELTHELDSAIVRMRQNAEISFIKDRWF